MRLRGRRRYRNIKSAQALYKPGALMFHDDFTDPDDTLLANHTNIKWNPLGLAWAKAHTYDLDIQNNKLDYTETILGPQHKDNDHYLEMYASAFTVEVDLKLEETGLTVAHSVVIRYIDNLNSVAVQWQKIGNTSHALVIRAQEGTEESGDQVAHIFTLPNGGYDTKDIHTESKLRIVDNGSKITASLLGQAVEWESTLHNTSTKVALRTDNKNNSTWDNLKIWKT